MNDVNKQRLQEEVTRLTTHDTRFHQEIKELSQEEQWKTILYEGYSQWYKILGIPQAADADVIPEPILGRFGIRQLLLEGKILNMKKETFLEYLSHMDNKSLGVIPFPDLFYWFCLKANEGSMKSFYKDDVDVNNMTTNSNSNMIGTGTITSLSSTLQNMFISSKTTSANKSTSGVPSIAKFTLRTIIPLERRAMIILYKRFGFEMQKSDDYDMEGFNKAYNELKRKKKMDDVEIDLREYDYDF